MKAVKFNEYGTARQVLRVVGNDDLPTPGANEVLVRIYASSVNPIDCAVRRGYGRAYFEAEGMSRLPICPGRDVAGEIVGTGPGVTRFEVGDAVYGATLGGSNAEYMTVRETLVSRKPHSLDYLRAAAIPYPALTVWSALVDSAGLTPANAPGKRVVIPRAAGGVGSIAVQLVKAWGGHVTAICSTRNVASVKSLGADEVIDYTQQDPRALLRDFDIAFDTSPDTESLLLNALKLHAEAHYVSIVSPRLRLVDQHGLEEGLRRGDELYERNVADQAALGRSYSWAFTQPNAAALEAITELIDNGKVRPVIDRTYRLDEIVEAHEFCESGRAAGRIIINVSCDV